MSTSISAARFPAVPLGKERSVTEAVSPDGFVLGEAQSDEALISRICEDDSDALGLLFSRYARLVWTIGRRILRNNEEADDLLQDVFLLVRRKASAFDPLKGSSRRRDLARRNFYSDRDVAGNTVVASRSSLPSYDEGLEARVGRARLRKALEDLSTEQRETIRLFFFEGFTLEEIAVRLDLTFGNVRHHYYRGLAKLRKHVASE